MPRPDLGYKACSGCSLFRACYDPARITPCSCPALVRPCSKPVLIRRCYPGNALRPTSQLPADLPQPPAPPLALARPSSSVCRRRGGVESPTTSPWRQQRCRACTLPTLAAQAGPASPIPSSAGRSCRSCRAPACNAGASLLELCAGR
jgi:hypothetical protein